MDSWTPLKLAWGGEICVFKFTQTIRVTAARNNCLARAPSRIGLLLLVYLSSLIFLFTLNNVNQKNERLQGR